MNACSTACGPCGHCTDDDEPIMTIETCFFCGDELPDSGFWPYCSSGCSAMAERESMEDSE